MYNYDTIHHTYTIYRKDNGVFLFNNRFGFDNELFLEKYFSIGIHPWDADLNSSFRNLKALFKIKIV